MSTEEDEKELELKDLILQTLESNGLLSKLKAQIRANVFIALDDSDKKSDNKLITVDNPFIKQLLSTKEGRLTVSLVREFLHACNLEYTLSVFEPEVNSDHNLETRTGLLKNFNLNETEETKQSPILYDLVKSNLINSSDSKKKIISQELSANLINDAKKKFDFYDKNKNGVIDKNELKELFIELNPTFNKGILERYVNDEFNAADRDISNGIDFNEFKSIYKRWFSLCRSVVSRDSNEIYSSEKSDKSDLSERSLKKRVNNGNKLIDKNTFPKETKQNALVDLCDDISSSSSTSMSEKTKREGITPRQNTSGGLKKSNNLLDFINNDKANDSTLPNIKIEGQVTSPIDDEFFNLVKNNSKPKSSNVNDQSKNIQSSANIKNSLKDAPSLFTKPNSNVNSLKDIDKKIKGLGFDYEDDNYDDDFTSGTTPRTQTHSGINDNKRRMKPRNQNSEDEIDENISYADESSKFDEVTIDKSIASNQANNEVDFIEDLSI